MEYASSERGRDAPDKIHGIARLYSAAPTSGDGQDRLAGPGGGGRGRRGPRNGQRDRRGPGGIRRKDPRRPASLDVRRVRRELHRRRVRETGKLDADFLKVLEVAASRAPVVEFFYEQPDAELVEIAHAGGALVSWQLGSAAEATAAERAGCDLIVAQGTEAGGHVRGKI